VYAKSRIDRNIAPSTTPSLSSSSNTPIGVASNSATPSGNSAQHPSMAWIAGAVIGPIALTAIVAGLVFLLYRRKRPGTELSADAPGLYQDRAPAKLVAELDGRTVGRV